MFLQTPAHTEATDRLYKSDVAQQGFVMNLSRLWAWRPEVCEAFGTLRTQLTGNSSLSNRELAVIVCATAASLGDSYCALAWGKKLAAAANPAAAAAVLQATENDDLTARDQALSIWARKVVRNPNATTPQDVEALRTAGFSEREIFEATAFVAFRLAFSTINDALGVSPDWQLAAAAPAEVNHAVTFGRPVAERR
ncbi:carboxymuconolactone decarboxylase family protein [Polaromonas aquatica]|uniref:carboxymuconolactone decarboxylase family protein n=1 Tax=Polaromonas aquatica TaxID=332657 RepID=UPI003D64C503